VFCLYCGVQTCVKAALTLDVCLQLHAGEAEPRGVELRESHPGAMKKIVSVRLAKHQEKQKALAAGAGAGRPAQGPGALRRRREWTFLSF